MAVVRGLSLPGGPGGRHLGARAAARRRHDLAAMADAITDQTRLIFVCNPNNPTGTVVHARRNWRSSSAAYRRTAWWSWTRHMSEYVRDPEVPDGMALYADRPNVAVLRTFSKAYGLAGLRVGFLVGARAGGGRGPQDDADVLGERAGPGRRDGIAGGRGRAARARRAGGQGARPGPRTSCLPRAGRCRRPRPTSSGCRRAVDTADFAASCDRAGISVRPYGDEGVRVSIGDYEANDAFLAAARDSGTPGGALRSSAAAGAADTRAPAGPARSRSLGRAIVSRPRW